MRQDIVWCEINAANCDRVPCSFAYNALGIINQTITHLQNNLESGVKLKSEYVHCTIFKYCQYEVSH